MPELEEKFTRAAPGIRQPMSRLDQIVNAVLYEGYILYPYRPSSKKNQQRFTFGRVYPEAYSVAQSGIEPCIMQTECLARTKSFSAMLTISIRFLQPMAREVGKLRKPKLGGQGEASFQIVPELRVDSQLYQTWQEAVEREIGPFPLPLNTTTHLSFPFCFSASQNQELICDKSGRAVGRLRRRQEALCGKIEIAAEYLELDIFKITVRIVNNTPVPREKLEEQEEILMRTFASAHTVLRIQGGEFVSMTDPPADCESAAAKCQNLGTWPVLVGDEEKGERDTVLSSPIILPDYPQIAQESAGDLFDGTEIDEILTLRIQTMTDDEKLEMRMVDEHARRLLERVENTSGQDMLLLHGAMREPRSFDEQIFGNSKRLNGVAFGELFLQPGDRVRISPKGRADVMDMALAGKTGIIEAVEEDAEGRVQLALVLPDDPGMDLGMMRQPGHRFFYGLDEIEPLGAGR